MKIIRTELGLFSLFVVGLLSACSDQPEQVASIDYETRVMTQVHYYIDNGEVDLNPLMILDGKAYKYDVLMERDTFKTFNDTIVSISSLSRSTASVVYGERAQNGVVIIATKKYLERD